MKQHLKHIYRSSFPSKETDGIICGDDTTYDYITDEEWRTLPSCEKCFSGVRDTEVISETPPEIHHKTLISPKTNLTIRKGIYLRQYLQENE